MAEASDHSLPTLLQKLSDEIQQDAICGSGEDAEQLREACARRVFVILQGVLRHCVERDAGVPSHTTC